MLPRITMPLVEVVIPSTKEKRNFRPMTVREEKILLRAKEGAAPNEIFLAINQVISNCSATPIDVHKLTIYDVEYLFIKIRAMSVGEVVDIVYTDPDDNNKQHKLEVNLEEVQVKFPDVKSNVVAVTDTAALTLKDPTAAVYSTETFANPDSTESDIFDALIVEVLDAYAEGDTVHKFKDDKPAEIKEFVDGLPVKVYGKLKEYIANLPSVYHEVKYTDSAGNEKTLKLSSLTDFFSF